MLTNLAHTLRGDRHPVQADALRVVVGVIWIPTSPMREDVVGVE
jgi:hypothetical protein